MSIKLCTGCKRSFDLATFHKDSRSSTGRVSRCPQCRATYRSVINEMLSNAKSRSKKRHLPFDLTKDDIRNQMRLQNNKCIYSGIELNWSAGNGGKQRVCPPDRASLDRIDSSLGYIKGNIQLVTDFANRIKTWYPHGDVLSFCKHVVALNERG